MPVPMPVSLPVAPCPECTRAIRHDLCHGPPCTCLQCGTRRIEGQARAHIALPAGQPGREALLAYDVAALLSLSAQRRSRRYTAVQRVRAPYPCACLRIRDGQPCMVTGAQKRSRIYASPGCKEYARRRRLMIASRAQLMRAAAGQAPDGWAAHWDGQP